MDYSNVFKIWGLRKRILLTETSEIDLLHIKKDSFCSTHTHRQKINKFTVLDGAVRIDSEYGSVVLYPGSSFEVRPPLKHRFFALADSIMIESAYVEHGSIDANDIEREKQGGRMIKGKEMTLDEMREKGLFEL